MKSEPLQDTQEREATAARRLIDWASLGVFITLWLVIYPHPYHVVCCAALIMPMLIVAIQLRYPRYIRLNPPQSGTSIPFATVLLSAPFGLVIRSAQDFELIDYAPFWPHFRLVGFAMVIVLAVSDRYFLFRSATVGRELVVVLFCALFYAFGGTYVSNTLFDTAPPQRYRLVVLNKHSSWHKTTTYYFTVSSWGPRSGTNDVTVSPSYYWDTHPGDSVTIQLHPGFLHVPWFTVEE